MIPTREELERRATSLRLLLSDVDGVLTDGGLLYLDTGGEAKRFDVKDGLGLVRARRAGLLTGVISGRPSKAVELRARELGLDEVHLGVADAKIKTWTGRTLEQNATYTEYVSGTGENSITIAEAPINSVTSLKLVDASGTATLTYDSDDYYVDAKTMGVIRLEPASEALRYVSDLHGGNQRNRWRPAAVFPVGHGNVEFKGDVGYETVPEDLKEAVWRLMAASMAEAGRDPSLAGIGLGAATASFRGAEESRAAAFELARPWRVLT